MILAESLGLKQGDRHRRADILGNRGTWLYRQIGAMQFLDHFTILKNYSIFFVPRIEGDGGGMGGGRGRRGNLRPLDLRQVKEAQGRGEY